MRILIVDDDECVLNAVARVFRDAGHEAETSWNGKQALNILRKAEDTDGMFDWVLSDVIMPIMHGYEFIEQARKLYPNIKFVMYSGDTSNKAPEGLTMLYKNNCPHETLLGAFE